MRVRRVAALAGILILIVLALTLLWRVYLHHEWVNPDEEGMTELAGPPGAVAPCGQDAPYGTALPLRRPARAVS
jgi:hypothetical protein